MEMTIERWTHPIELDAMHLTVHSVWLKCEANMSEMQVSDNVPSNWYVLFNGRTFRFRDGIFLSFWFCFALFKIYCCRVGGIYWFRFSFTISIEKALIRGVFDKVLLASTSSTIFIICTNSVTISVSEWSGS